MKSFWKTPEEWENSGLLKDIPEDRKQMVVNCFNIAVDWLTADKVVSADDTDGQIETLILPLFYRIAKEVDLNKTQVLETCKEFRQSWLHADMTRYAKLIDPEAAFLRAFAEMKVNQYKNQNNLI
jgi:hypothetical protein